MLEKIKKKIENHYILTSLLFNVLLFMIPYIFGTIKYEVSDDFIMNLIVSGVYTENPSPYLMFMNPIIGQLLSCLFTFTNNVNWYSLFHLTVVFLSLTIIGICILNKKRWYSFLFFFIFLTITSLDLYQLMQFTKTSIICVIAGGMIFFEYLKDGHKSSLILSLFFTILGSLIRFQCLYLGASLLFVDSLIFMFFNKENLKYYLKREVKFIILLIIFIFGSIFYSNYFDQTHTEYKAYKEFGEVRAELLDYKLPKYEAIESELVKIQISKNDYETLISWNFADTDFYTTEKIRSVLEIVKQYRNDINLSFKEIIKELYYRKYWLYLGFWLCLSIFIMLIFIDFRLIPSSIFISFLGIGLLFINVLIGRLVYRVEYAVFIEVAAALIVLTEFFDVNSSKNKFLSVLEIIILTVCLILKPLLSIPLNSSDKFNIMYYSWNNDLKKYNLVFSKDDLKELQLKLKMERGNNFYLGFQTGIQTYYLSFDPLEPIEKNRFNNLIYLTGVDTNNPAKEVFLKNHNISNVAEALLHENSYLIENIYQDQIYQYILEHFDKKVIMKKVDNINGYDIWKFEN